MYEWRPEDDLEEQLSLMAEPSTFPLTSLGHLQLLFARLQFGNERFIDPSDFVHSLGLDTTQQQDAQVTSKIKSHISPTSLGNITKCHKTHSAL